MKNLITLAIILALLSIIVVQKACKPSVEKPKADTVKIVKTVYITIHDTIKTSPKIITKILPGKQLPPQYIPDTNYAKLKAQFQKLVAAHLTKNVYTDTLKLDSLGTVTINDTTQFNKLGRRGYLVDLKIPKQIVNNYITTPQKPVRQVYFGVGVTSTTTVSNVGLRGSLLYKDKKDNMFSPSATVLTNGIVVYGIDTYFKIKLK